MIVTPEIIFYVFLLLQTILINGYDSEKWIQSALENWTLSTQIYESSALGIVGYDSQHNKVIMFGGRKVDDIDTPYDGHFHGTVSLPLFIYDIITDKETLIQIEWNMDLFGELINGATTNAVINNSTLFFTIPTHLLSIDLDPIYSHVYISTNLHKNSSNQPIFKPDILLNGSEFNIGYVGGGCIVIDESQQYLFISGESYEYDHVHGFAWHYNATAVYHIDTKSFWVGGFTNYYHEEGACVVMNDVFYIIGGGFIGGFVEFMDIDKLLRSEYMTFEIEKGVYNPSLQATLDKEDFGIRLGLSVIQDPESDVIYILGGNTEQNGDNGEYTPRDIYKFDATLITMEKLDIKLPYPGLQWCTTIYHNRTGRIYAFRGDTSYSSTQVAYTTKIHNLTLHINESIDSSLSQLQSESAEIQYLYRVELMMALIIVIGVICICGTIAIGLCCMYKIKQHQVKNSDQEQLIEAD